ncbi:amino acid permease [Paenibacillus antri]|uniref:Amino acid permease n=1 Tax=Paenibacillus antri TaxID=2582848 RepID=A0A5R9GAH9_9BACL|nr:amino acid permease [Paenibacillus antri]TLS51326.1 amino acid permease [Paenibacillus antri]
MSDKQHPTSGAAASRGTLKWWQLTLLGLGFTTGTGFFLGSGIAIERASYAVLVIFVLAAIGTYFVYDALSCMIAEKPEKGSFRTYTKHAFGHWAGFSHGWMYWLSEMLILGSQLTALGLFTRFWYDKIPLWGYAAAYSVLGVAIVLLGQKGFEKAENVFAVLKVTALVMFIVLAFLVIPGVLGQENAHMHSPKSVPDFFEHGAMGMWTGFVFAFFAFAGIEVMGLMATELKTPKDAPKAGKVMIGVVTVLYTASLALALVLAPKKDFSPDESPFVTALKDLDYHMIVSIFNGVLIIAGFSSLVASLFSTTKIMYSIAQDGDAPKLFTKQTKKRKLPYMALFLTIGGMIVSIVVALALPKSVYEYITTAGGLMLLFSWLFMVLSARRLTKLTVWAQVKSATAIVLIAAAVTGTLFDKSSRPGFFASIGFMAAIIGVALILQFTKWKGGGGGTKPSPDRADTQDEEEETETEGSPFRERIFRKRRALQKQ